MLYIVYARLARYFPIIYIHTCNAFSSRCKFTRILLHTNCMASCTQYNTRILRTQVAWKGRFPVISNIVSKHRHTADSNIIKSTLQTYCWNNLVVTSPRIVLVLHQRSSFLLTSLLLFVCIFLLVLHVVSSLDNVECPIWKIKTSSLKRPFLHSAINSKWTTFRSLKQKKYFLTFQAKPNSSRQIE